jgi:hypothetical protein
MLNTQLKFAKCLIRFLSRLLKFVPLVVTVISNSVLLVPMHFSKNLKNHTKLYKTYQKFKEFLLKRIAEQLFENDDIITKIIKFSGGSPRQLLMICSNIYPNAKDDDQKITAEVVDKVLKKMSNDKASLITKQMFEKIKEINHCVLKGEKPLYDEVLQKLLEEDYVFEYNSGTYKRVNPILELSDHFMKHVS